MSLKKIVSKGTARAEEDSDYKRDYAENVTLHSDLALRTWIRDGESILHKENITDPDPRSGGEKESGGASWLPRLLRPFP